MIDTETAVFFYGLFMDTNLLASRGIEPSRAEIAYLDGYGLRIGRRATLVRQNSDRAYGVLMYIGHRQVLDLYAQESVADYLAEPVTVTLASGGSEPAICYNLPASKIEGANTDYAEALLRLAIRLDFPQHYLETIRMQQAAGVQSAK